MNDVIDSMSLRSGG